MRVLLTESDFGLGYELTPVNQRAARQYQRESGHESVLVNLDWDFPSLAESLGWSIRKVQRNRRKPCDHSSTDGTVTCSECGLTADDFISAAREWLDSRASWGTRFNRDVETYFGW